MKTVNNIFLAVMVSVVIISLAFLALIPDSTSQIIPDKAMFSITVRLVLLSLMCIALLYEVCVIFLTYRAKGKHWKRNVINGFIILFVLIICFSCLQLYIMSVPYKMNPCDNVSWWRLSLIWTGLIIIYKILVTYAKSEDAWKYSGNNILRQVFEVYAGIIGLYLALGLLSWAGVKHSEGWRLWDIPPPWWWLVSILGPIIILSIVRLFLFNKHKQILPAPKDDTFDDAKFNTIKTHNILIIGGPEEAKCSAEGITHVPWDPISVLKLNRHLYDYDIVIFWPTVCSINDFKLNITKDELSKDVPCDYFDRYHHYSTNQRTIAKYLIMFLKGYNSFWEWVRANMIKDVVSPRILHRDFQLSMSKYEYTRRDVAALFNKKEYIICGGNEHNRFDRLITTLDNMSHDNKQEKVDDNDKRNVYAWYNEKLCEILLGIANKQLAFVVVPTNKYYDQSPDIFSWIPFDIRFDYDPATNVSINKAPAVNPHPMQTIMEGLGPLVNGWTSRIAIIPSLSYPDRLLILGSRKTLLMKIKGYKSRAFRGDSSNSEREDAFPNNGGTVLSICEGHTDGSGDARSLMMLTEKGGLAVIPEPKSIDDLVGLITTSTYAEQDTNVEKKKNGTDVKQIEQQPLESPAITEILIFVVWQKISNDLDQGKEVPLPSQVFIRYCRDRLTLKMMERKYQWSYRTLKARKAELKKFLYTKFNRLTLEAFFVDLKLFNYTDKRVTYLQKEKQERLLNEDSENKS